jgi:hydrogenase-4 component B
MDFGVLALHFCIDGFRLLYGCIAVFLWLVTSLFSPEYFSHSGNQNRCLHLRYWLFNLLVFCAVMGVFFSADFRTCFLFFELMSFCSYALVAHDESPAALRAAETYLAVAIIGGLSQFIGMLLLQQRAATLEFAGLYEVCVGLPGKPPQVSPETLYLPGAFLLAGFGAKAGMYPLHIWLPKAHPVAPAPASALLSGVLTKTGVFAVAALSCNVFRYDYKWGIALLILSIITMVHGALLAVFSNDLKRTIACSSVSQIGFILTGVAMQVLLGEHNALAIRGVLLHMVNHSLIKLILFIAAGVVYMNRHELQLDKIRGFGRGKPLFLFVFLMAGLGISGVPLLSGYISKTLLHESIVEAIQLYHGFSLEPLLQLTNAAFLLSGGLTIAYMTKLFAALFIGRCETTEMKKPYISRRSAAALAASAALLPLMGCFTAITNAMAGLGQSFFHGHSPEHEPHYFALENLKSFIFSVVLGAIIYLFIVRRRVRREMLRKEEGPRIYTASWPEWLDLENLLYRPLLGVLIRTTGFLANAAASLPDRLVHLALNTVLCAGRTFRMPGFLTLRFQAIRQNLQTLREKPAMLGLFSLDLLLVGAGICIALLYVFCHAFG